MKLLVLAFVLMISCTSINNSLIYYSSNGTTITRISHDGYSRFYYGKYNKSQLKTLNSFINVEYPGFNNGMDLWLIFKNNKDVEVIDFGGGWITIVGDKNPHFYHCHYQNEEIHSILNSYRASGKGMFRVSDIKPLEKKNNPDSSKVFISYE